MLLAIAGYAAGVENTGWVACLSQQAWPAISALVIPKLGVALASMTFLVSGIVRMACLDNYPHTVSCGLKSE